MHIKKDGRRFFRYRKMWLALYLLNFGFALLASLPFSGYLSKTLGQSLEMERHLEGFDYTFINDFLREYGQGISAFIDTSLGFIFLYLLFSVALMGGILLAFQHFSEAFRWSTFWEGCRHFFWRLLRLTIYFILIHAAILGLFGLFFYLATHGFAIFEMETELELVRPLYYLLPLYLLTATIIFMIQDYAKIHVVQVNQQWLTRPIWQATELVYRNFGRFFFLYLLNIATLIALFAAYWWIGQLFSTTTNTAIALSFFWGQFFVFGRIGLRLLNLGSATYL